MSQKVKDLKLWLRNYSVPYPKESTKEHFAKQVLYAIKDYNNLRHSSVKVPPSVERELKQIDLKGGRRGTPPGLDLFLIEYFGDDEAAMLEGVRLLKEQVNAGDWDKTTSREGEITVEPGQSLRITPHLKNSNGEPLGIDEVWLTQLDDSDNPSEPKEEITSRLESGLEPSQASFVVTNHGDTPARLHFTVVNRGMYMMPRWRSVYALQGKAQQSNTDCYVQEKEGGWYLGWRGMGDEVERKVTRLECDLHYFLRRPGNFRYVEAWRGGRKTAPKQEKPEQMGIVIENIEGELKPWQKRILDHKKEMDEYIKALLAEKKEGKGSIIYQTHALLLLLARDLQEQKKPFPFYGTPMNEHSFYRGGRWVNNMGVEEVWELAKKIKPPIMATFDRASTRTPKGIIGYVGERGNSIPPGRLASYQEVLMYNVFSDYLNNTNFWNEQFDPMLVEKANRERVKAGEVGIPGRGEQPEEQVVRFRGGARRTGRQWKWGKPKPPKSPFGGIAKKYGVEEKEFGPKEEMDLVMDFVGAMSQKGVRFEPGKAPEREGGARTKNPFSLRGQGLHQYGKKPRRTRNGSRT